jgi:hypothetical protein
MGGSSGSSGGSGSNPFNGFDPSQLPTYTAYRPPKPDDRMNRAILVNNLGASKNLYKMGLGTADLQAAANRTNFQQGNQLSNLVSGQQQEAANRILGYAASQPIETWTPDIFGNQGALTQSAQIAAINQFKSRELEKQQNAPAAQAREQLAQTAANVSSPDYWQKQMNEWARTKGLQSYLGSGLQDSTIGKSGYFDQATPQGQAFMAQNAALAKGLIGEQQQIGIDPNAAIAQLQGAQAQAMQDRATYKAGILGATEQAAQSGINAQANAANAYQSGSGQFAKTSSDWINQLMGGYGQSLQQQAGSLGAYENKRSVDMQNYQQALMDADAMEANFNLQRQANIINYNNSKMMAMHNADVQRQASKNASQGALFSGLGQLGGGIAGGVGMYAGMAAIAA